MKEEHSHSEFDRHFQEAFQDAEITPSPAVWDQVETRLDRKRKRPGAWLWFGLGALLLLAGLGVKFLLPVDEAHKTLTQVTPSTTQTISPAPAVSDPVLPRVTEKSTEPASAPPTDSEQKKGAGQAVSSSVPDKNRVSDTKVNSPSSGEKPTTSSSDNSNNTKTKNTLSPAPVTSAKVETASSMSSSSRKSYTSPDVREAKQPAPDTHTDMSHIPDNKNKPGGTDNQVNKDAVSTPAKTTVPEKSNGTSDNTRTTETVRSTIKTETTPLPKTDAGKTGDIAMNSSLKSASPLPAKTEIPPNADKTNEVKTNTSIVSNPLPVKPDSAGVSPKKPDSTTQAVVIPPVKPGSSATDSVLPIHLFSIRGYFSPELNQGGISANSSSFSNVSENRNPKYSGGLKACMAFRDKLEVSVGLAYSRINQEFAPTPFTFPRELHGQPFIFNSSLGDMPVDATTMLSGFSPSAPSFITHFNAKYQYTQTVEYINMPLEATWHFGHKRLSFFAAGGLNIQYAFREHATLELIKENEIDRIDYGSLPVTQVNYGLQLGLGAEYKLTKHLGMYIEPNGRYNLLPQAGNSSIRASSYFIGAAGGLKYTF